MSLFGRAKVCLALGGGGSRGLAHLGVLRVLEKNGIPIDGMVGTSVGSIVGAAYAYNPNIDELTETTLEFLRSDRFQNDHFRRMMFGANNAEQNMLQAFFSGLRRSISFASLIHRSAIFDGQRLRDVIAEFVPDVDFEELAIPYAVPAIDLKQPNEVMLGSGDLRTAVVASCSLPGFFPPVEIDDMLLADVGVIGSVPVCAARELVPGCVVIAVDLSTEIEPIEQVDRGWDAILRCENIASNKLGRYELAQADVVIRPEIGERYWSDFTELDNMVEAGARGAEAKLQEIHSRFEGVMRFLRVRSAVKELKP